MYIFINQKDIEEKKQQIPLMGDIYSRARIMVIWLGEEADGSSKAVNLIWKLRRIDPKQLKNKSRTLLFREPSSFLNGGKLSFLRQRAAVWTRRGDSPGSSSSSDRGSTVTSLLANFLGRLTIRLFSLLPRELHDEIRSYSYSSGSMDSTIYRTGERKLSQGTLPHRNDPSWEALRTFLSRPWFSRVWVVQEVAMARRAIVLCGGKTLTWQHLRSLAAMMAEA
jgi:hypothetical protein